MDTEKLALFDYLSTHIKSSVLKSPILFLLIVLFPILLSAQEEDKTQFPLEKFYVERKKNPVSFLKDIKFSASIGAGNTFLSHKLTDFGIYQLPGQAPTLFDKQPASVFQVNPPQLYPTNLDLAIRYSNWINDVTQTSAAIGASPFNPPNLQNITSSPLTFHGIGFNVPLKFTIHYEYKQFRIGAGYSYELMMLGSFNATPTSSDVVYSVKPSSSIGFMSKYFGIIGYSFYRWDKYLFTVDANIGNFSPGSNFNNALIQKSLYYNLGLTIEKDFSEYLKAFVRPSIEMKSYSISLAPSGKSIDHSMNAIYINVGFTYSIPELPKCYNKDCRVQINHAHGNKEYRSRAHKITEVQNPGYGENDPVLIKYKGKNKRKLNPY